MFTFVWHTVVIVVLSRNTWLILISTISCKTPECNLRCFANAYPSTGLFGMCYSEVASQHLIPGRGWIINRVWSAADLPSACPCPVRYIPHGYLVNQRYGILCVFCHMCIPVHPDSKWEMHGKYLFPKEYLLYEHVISQLGQKLKSHICNHTSSTGWNWLLRRRLRRVHDWYLGKGVSGDW